MSAIMHLNLFVLLHNDDIHTTIISYTFTSYRRSSTQTCTCTDITLRCRRSGLSLSITYSRTRFLHDDHRHHVRRAHSLARALLLLNQVVVAPTLVSRLRSHQPLSDGYATLTRSRSRSPRRRYRPPWSPPRPPPLRKCPPPPRPRRAGPALSSTPSCPPPRPSRTCPTPPK
eukprot:298886-Prorocentrum_minimum.AAC.1